MYDQQVATKKEELEELKCVRCFAVRCRNSAEQQQPKEPSQPSIPVSMQDLSDDDDLWCVSFHILVQLRLLFGVEMGSCFILRDEYSSNINARPHPTHSRISL